MRTFYINPSDETNIFDLDDVLDYLADEELEEYMFEKAEPDNDKNLMWCIEMQEAGYKIDFECGKTCQYYKPINGKWGMCKHQGKTYSGTGEFETIKLK